MTSMPATILAIVGRPRDATFALVALAGEPQTEVQDPDYAAELGDDLPGAMSHPTS